MTVPGGAVYHLRSKRRREVAFDAGLRRRTEEAAVRLHALLAAGVTPPPVPHPKCRQCSVRELCLPDLVAATSQYERAVTSLFQVPADEP